MGETAEKRRVDRSRDEIEFTLARMTNWFAARRDADQIGHHHTQLQVLQKFLDTAMNALKDGVAKIDIQVVAMSDVYETCRTFDLRRLLVERVWHHFREKFDQRDDPDFTEILHAADEVVWSCHRQAAEAGVAVGPAPLAFIESRYSPEVFPSEIVPSSLTREADRDFVMKHVARLPFSVVRLPPSVKSAPWELIFVGHEVGHCLQFDLGDGRGMIDDFGDTVARIARRKGGDDVDDDLVERWRRWSIEIFADAVGLVAHGPAFVTAMAEAELRAEGRLDQERGSYPSPRVRIAVLMAMTKAVRAPTPVLPSVFTTSLDDTTRNLVDAVATCVTKTLPGRDAGLRDLVKYRSTEHAVGGRVEEWATKLPSSDEGDFPAGLRTARLLVAAGVYAWSAATTSDDVATLTRRLPKRIVESRAPGQRDASGAVGDDGEEAGVDFAKTLLGMESAELERA